MTQLQVATNPNVIRNKTYIPLDVKSWKLIDAKQVSIKEFSDKAGNPIAQININDNELIHVFDKNSRISKALSITPTNVLEQRFVGGKFFTINDELVDFRDNTYNGFVHSNNSIEKLIEIIGVSKITNRHAGLKHSSTTGNIVLTNTWGKSKIDIPEYQSGGEFDSILRYAWSPFSQSIRSIFELVRLICANGMVGVSDFFNAKIPVINRWEEHMNIAYKQIQNKVQGYVRDRLIEMGNERASVGELLQISSHATERATKQLVSSSEERQRLLNIAKIADPKQHLSKYYKQAAFDDKNIAKRLPGHLTTFDAWNLVTEMYSHTNASPESSDVALQRLANMLMFDHEKRTQRMIDINTNNKTLSAFSSPKQAFFGTLE